MKHYTLSGFVSPIEYHPSFLIPTFSCVQTNSVFAQNLEPTGKIKEFLPIEIARYTPILASVPSFSRKIGEDGLLAYWYGLHDVICLPKKEMADYLNRGILTDPFTRLELSSLSDNAKLLKISCEEIAEMFGDPDIAHRWVTRQQRYFFQSLKKRGEAPKTQSKLIDKYEQTISGLLNEPDSKNWVSQWHKLFVARYQPDKVTKIALWWLEQGHSKSPEASVIFSETAYTEWRDLFADHSLNWLEAHDYDQFRWIYIFYALIRRGYGSKKWLRKSALDIAYHKLEQHLPEDGHIAKPWLKLWNSLWRSNDKDRAMVYMIENLIDRQIDLGSTFVENVGFHLSRSDKCSNKITDYIIQNLFMYQKSTRVWAETYLHLSRKFSDQKLDDCGVSWLQNLGGNTNIWYEVWKSIKGRIPDNLHVNLALSWLERARSDLKNWPLVYSEIAVKSIIGDRREELINIGIRWIEPQPYYNRTQARVRDALKYLRTFN